MELMFFIVILVIVVLINFLVMKVNWLMMLVIGLWSGVILDFYFGEVDLKCLY